MISHGKMSSTIYYFSGTGNCLSVAREISEGLGECHVAPMVKLIGGAGAVEDGDVVGFVFPVNFWDVPDIVARSVRRLKLREDAYVFAVVTYGASAGPVLSGFERILKEKGVKLSAGFLLKMPDNYIITLNTPTPEEQGRILGECKGLISGIVEKVKNKERQGAGHPGNPILSLGGHAFKYVSLNYYRASKKFWTTNQCIGCGTCKKICPTSNIEIVDKKVMWRDNCVQCLACVHWCPKEAIQVGGRTSKKKRYHHPDVTLKDMLLQAPGKK
jgi:ferredoxin